MNNVKTFKFLGDSSDICGVPSYCYESTKWMIDVWQYCTVKPDIHGFRGVIEDFKGNAYEFMIQNNYFQYNRIIQSQYEGLGKRYDEFDKIIPRYVIEFIKSLYIEYQQKGNSI